MNVARERLIVSGLLAATCWLWVSAASAQSGRRLEGRILDPTGAGIPGAKVTLFSDDRVRTTIAGWDGEFVFADLTGAVHYVEASSTGFRSTSISITDSVPEPISITLQVGSCTSCPFLVDVRDHSVYYEERSGREQLTGTVSEFSGPRLPSTLLKLMKADLDTTERRWPKGQSPAMDGRSFEYTFVAQGVSDEKGEFQFTGLEPGWYSLTAGRVGYYDEIVKFWIARETLTRPARIELVREGPGQASPFRSVFGEIEIPLTPARLPDIPLIPPSQ